MKGKFWGFMERLADIFALNTLFLLSCLPFVTVGAALAALYETWFQFQSGTNSTLFHTYWRALAHNLKQGVFLWLLYIFLAVDAWLLLSGSSGAAGAPNGGLGAAVAAGAPNGGLGAAVAAVASLSQAGQAAALLFAVLYVFTILYVFPVAAYFRCSVWQCLLNAVGLAFCHPLVTIGILVIWVLAALFIRLFPFLLLLLPAFCVLLTAWLEGRLFKLRIQEKENEGQSQEAERSF